MASAAGQAGLIASVLALSLLQTASPSASATAKVKSPDRARVQAPDVVPGFMGLLKALYREVENDRVLAVAAGVAFYGLLALFPAITAFVSIYGLFKDRAAAAQDIAMLTALLPASTVSVVSEQVDRIVSADQTGLTLAAGLSLLIALWSANSGMKAAMDALNVAYDVKETRSFIWLNAVSLGFTLSAIVLMIGLLASIALVPALLDAAGLGVLGDALLRYGRWPAVIIVVLLGLAVLYRWGPCVPDASWRWISPGSALAGAGFVILSFGFSLYAENFAAFNETYGTLGAVIAFLTWSWLATVIMLVGAELNAELDRRKKLRWHNSVARDVRTRR